MELTKEQRSILTNWANQYLIPIETINDDVDTALLRKTFMDAYAHGFYVDNDTVNSVMLELGYQAANYANDPYFIYNVSSQSPAILKYRREIAKHPSGVREKYE